MSNFFEAPIIFCNLYGAAEYQAYFISDLEFSKDGWVPREHNSERPSHIKYWDIRLLENDTIMIKLIFFGSSTGGHIHISDSIDLKTKFTSSELTSYEKKETFQFWLKVLI